MRHFMTTYYGTRRHGLMAVHEYNEVPHVAECYDGLGDKTINFDLDNHQISQVLAWMDGTYLLQEVAPDLSAEQREMCLSGLDNDSFPAALGKEKS